MVGMFQAPPGTRLFDRLQRESRVVDTFSGDSVDGKNNIVPRMGMDRLLDGYRSIVKRIYSPESHYERVGTLSKEWRAPEMDQPINIQRFLSIFRSALRLGGLGKERFECWRLFLWTLITKPRLFPVAITLSI
jgi:hypothetical protein